MKLTLPKFGLGDLETLNKLYLELSLVCMGATSWREQQYEAEIARLNEQLSKFRAKVNQQAFEHAETERQRHELEKKLAAVTKGQP